jgi:hypothetical protein
VKREDIFITTKIPGPIGSDAVQKMVLNETLPKLGVEYVIQMQFSSLLFEYYLSTDIYRLYWALFVVASKRQFLSIVVLDATCTPRVTKPCCTCSATY